MTSPFLSYDWIRTIEPELKQLDAVPLTGSAPPFPWEQLSQLLAKVFQKESLSIIPLDTQWVSGDQLMDSLGDDPYPIALSIPPLAGKAWWILPQQDIAILTNQLMIKEHQPELLIDPELTANFYRFFVLECLYQFTQLKLDTSLSPILVKESELPKESALCLDLLLSIEGAAPIFGRFIISAELRSSWAKHFSSRSPSRLNSALAESATAILSIEAGKAQMNLKQWREIQMGDFIILDNADLQGEHFEGRVLLTVNGRRAFRAKIKDGNVKILEFPLSHELEKPMPSPYESEGKPKKENDSDLDDFDLDESFDIEDTLSHDETIEDSINDETKEETLELETEEPGTPSNQDTAAAEKKEAAEQTAVAKNTEDQRFIAPEQIPLSLVVELGRFEVTVQKLLELQPGNLLELNIHPESGVDLVINGKAVGKGELIRIGEVLGVRILDLGK